MNCEDRRRMRKGCRQPEVRSYHRETAEDDDDDEDEEEGGLRQQVSAYGVNPGLNPGLEHFK
jgi:hypothetical protein